MSELTTPLLQLRNERIALPVLPAAPQPAERVRLERRARLLAWGGIAWRVVEFGIALAAGLAAGSIALIGFGADSLIEALAGGVVLWLFTGNRRGSSTAERRAQQLIAVSFFVLAAYVGIERCGRSSMVIIPAQAGSASASLRSPRRRCRFSPTRSGGSATNSTPPPPSRKRHRRSSAATSRSRC